MGLRANMTQYIFLCNPGIAIPKEIMNTTFAAFSNPTFITISIYLNWGPYFTMQRWIAKFVENDLKKRRKINVRLSYSFFLKEG